MSGWRTFFWVAAANNLAIGAVAFLDAAWGSPEAMGGVLIACFGIVYALVARDPARFAPVLWAGVVGKLLVVAMLGPRNWSDGGDPIVGTIVAADLAFALGFLLFLWRQRAAATG